MHACTHQPCAQTSFRLQLYTLFVCLGLLTAGTVVFNFKLRLCRHCTFRPWAQTPFQLHLYALLGLTNRRRFCFSGSDSADEALEGLKHGCVMGGLCGQIVRGGQIVFGAVCGMAADVQATVCGSVVCERVSGPGMSSSHTTSVEWALLRTNIPYTSTHIYIVTVCIYMQ